MKKNEKLVASLAGLAAALVIADKAVASLQLKIEQGEYDGDSGFTKAWLDPDMAEVVNPTDVQP